jgi:hypothetical protein
VRALNCLGKYLKFAEKELPSEWPEMAHLKNEIAKIRPFLFTSIEDFDKVRGLTPSPSLHYLPFKYCSFEFMEPIGLNDGTDPNGWRRNTKFENPCIMGQIFRENDDLSIDHVYIISDVAHLDERTFYDIKSIPPVLALHRTHFENYNSLYPDLKFILYYLSLKTNKLGLTRGVRFRQKGLHPDFVKRIIVVSRAKSNDDRATERAIGEPIEWQHQWRVRGHWRKISDQMVGKDREGDYCIVGRTWVKDFVKGDGPLIEKTRILKGGNNGISKCGNFAR